MHILFEINDGMNSSKNRYNWGFKSSNAHRTLPDLGLLRSFLVGEEINFDGDYPLRYYHFNLLTHVLIDVKDLEFVIQMPVAVMI